MPMFQADALWLNFTPLYDETFGDQYPIAIKIGTGKICAISGDKWNSSLNRDPQDYIQYQVNRGSMDIMLTKMEP